MKLRRIEVGYLSIALVLVAFSGCQNHTDLNRMPSSEEDVERRRLLLVEWKKNLVTLGEIQQEGVINYVSPNEVAEKLASIRSQYAGIRIIVTDSQIQSWHAMDTYKVGKIALALKGSSLYTPFTDLTLYLDALAKKSRNEGTARFSLDISTQPEEMRKIVSELLDKNSASGMEARELLTKERLYTVFREYLTRANYYLASKIAARNRYRDLIVQQKASKADGSVPERFDATRWPEKLPEIPARSEGTDTAKTSLAAIKEIRRFKELEPWMSSPVPGKSVSEWFATIRTYYNQTISDAAIRDVLEKRDDWEKVFNALSGATDERAELRTLVEYARKISSPVPNDPDDFFLDISKRSLEMERRFRSLMVARRLTEELKKMGVEKIATPLIRSLGIYLERKMIETTAYAFGIEKRNRQSPHLEKVPRELDPRNFPPTNDRIPSYTREGDIYFERPEPVRKRPSFRVIPGGKGKPAL